MHTRSIKGPEFTAGWEHYLQTRRPLGGGRLPATAVAMFPARPEYSSARGPELDTELKFSLEESREVAKMSDSEGELKKREGCFIDAKALAF